MNEVLQLLLIFGVFFLLTRVILPKLGIKG